MNKNSIVWIVVGLIAIASIVYAAVQTAPAELAKNTQDPEQVFCTTDAKLCPDGSYVDRSGPDCAFTACPETPTTPTPAPSGY